MAVCSSKHVKPDHQRKRIRELNINYTHDLRGLIPCRLFRIDHIKITQEKKPLYMQIGTLADFPLDTTVQPAVWMAGTKHHCNIPNVPEPGSLEEMGLPRINLRLRFDQKKSIRYRHSIASRHSAQLYQDRFDEYLWQLKYCCMR